MKKLLLSILVFSALALSLTSCNSEDSTESGTSNYWAGNALNRMQLRGNVKTLTVNGDYTTVYQFNTDGNLTSKVSTGYGSTSSYEYTYQNGMLLSETATSTYNSAAAQREQTVTVTTYEYNNVGKFIPRGPFHLYETGLVPALSAAISANSRVDYTFHGSDLWIVSTYDGTPGDTTIFRYEGNYPKSSSTKWSYIENLTFASNGMFKTYTEGFSGEGYNDKRAYSFLPNEKFQLKDKIVNTLLMNGETQVKTTQYTYNDHQCVVSEVSPTWSTEWTDYVYDTQGNWTSRKTRYTTGENTWSDYTTETRTIVYY